MAGLLVVTPVALAGPEGTADPVTPKKLQMVFAIDGSGSIDTSDWNIEVTSIAQSVLDTAVVPRDGSVAVGVVQWSAAHDSNGAYRDDTRVEVPITEIDSGATAAAVATQIESIAQLGGDTNPGAGIHVATDQLAGLDSSAEQAICITTDGERNAGPFVYAERSRATEAGVDREAVVAMPDADFTEARAQTVYNEALIGEGRVTWARSFREFALAVTNGCFQPIVEVEGLEVTQGTQDLQGTVPLVAERPTFVRVYASPLNGEPTEFTMRLKGRRDGAELGALTPMAYGKALLRPDPISRRDQFSPYTNMNSLTFELPAAWTATTSSSGPLELEVDAMGARMTCSDAWGAKDCKATVTFVPTRPPAVVFVSMPLRLASGGVSVASPAQVAEAQVRTYAAQPFRDTTGMRAAYSSSVIEEPVPPPGSGPDVVWPWAGRTLNRLVEYAHLDGCTGSCPTIYYGVVSYPDGVLGLSDGGTHAFSLTADNRLRPQSMQTPPHEIGHSLGIKHPSPVALGPGERGTGTCREATAGPAPAFPFYKSFGSVYGAAMGPTSGPREGEVYGFDITHPSQIDTVSDWRVIPELMSYTGVSQSTCPYSPPPRSHGVWPSSDTWTRAVKFLQDSIDSTPTPGEFTSGNLLVTGALHDGTLSFEPAVRLPANETVPADGTYTLVQVTTSGAERRTAVAPYSLDGIGELDDSGLRLGFTTVVSATNLMSLELLAPDGTSLGKVTGRASSPTLFAPTLSSGPVLSAPFTMSWTGDAGLNYAVQWSPNGTSNWSAVAVDTKATSVTIDPATLRASPTGTGVLRLTASDGVRTTERLVTGLTVADHTPVVRIDDSWLQDTYTSYQLIQLRPITSDVDFRSFDAPPSVTWRDEAGRRWSSNSKGILSMYAADLAPGLHTFTATTADGLGSASVSFTVDPVLDAGKPPVVGATTLTPGALGAPSTLRTSVTDEDANAPLTGFIDWGDGTHDDFDVAPSERASIVRPHVYNRADTYTVTVRMIDPTGQIGLTRIAQKVGSIDPPVLSAAAAAPACGAAPGTPVTLTATVAGGSPITATVRWGDGSSTAVTPTNGTILASHAYGKAGAYVAQIDASNAAGAISMPVTVLVRGVAAGATTGVVVGTTGNDVVSITSLALSVAIVTNIPGATLTVVPHGLSRVDVYGCGGKDTITSLGPTAVIKH